LAQEEESKRKSPINLYYAEARSARASPHEFLESFATIPHIRLKSLVEKYHLCRKNNMQKLKEGGVPGSPQQSYFIAVLRFV
jgi:hypothetical protein